MFNLFNISSFLIQIAFNIIIYVLWIRIILRFLKVSLANPINSNINDITNYIFHPIEKLIFGKPLPIQQYDWVAIIGLIVIEIIKLIILSLLLLKILLPLTALLIFLLADLIIRFCDILFYFILLHLIISWVAPNWQHPVNDLIKVITTPLLRLGHKIVPNISGFDFAPFIIMIILKIITLAINSMLPLHL